MPAFRVGTVNATGCGDGLVAGLLDGILSQMALEKRGFEKGNALGYNAKRLGQTQRHPFGRWA